MPAPGLSFVLPVYNEARVLERTFATLVPFLEGLGRPFEIVCVNDGSTDGSAALLEEAARREARIRVLSLPENRGKGAAVRTGMLAAEGALIFFLDADLSTPLEETTGFLAALDSGCDVVIGNRRSPGSRLERRQPWLRETLGKGFTFLTRTFLAPGVQDFTCGFKGFRREAARRVFERSTQNGWAFDAEVVVIAMEQKLKLAQMPIAWRNEDDTKVRLFAAVTGSALELVKIAWLRMRGHYRR